MNEFVSKNQAIRLIKKIKTNYFNVNKVSLLNSLDHRNYKNT